MMIHLLFFVTRATWKYQFFYSLKLIWFKNKKMNENKKEKTHIASENMTAKNDLTL